MDIIKAKTAHVESITKLIRNAIISLCVKDHDNKERNINNWLTDRTVEKVAELMAVAGATTWLGVEADVVVGVSLITREGKLELCYVDPKHIGRGVGRRLLGQAEQTARQNAVNEVRLISTATAKSFYQAHGYYQHAEPVLQFGMPGYPMCKQLSGDKQ